MSRWFYHPLGDYAKNYVEGTVGWSARPHSRIDHGFNKIDYGCGYNLPIYSMTDGTVTTSGWIGGDGVSRWGVIIKCSNNGYSEMMAKLRNGSPEDFPIYISYIEMDRKPEVGSGDNVSPGTLLGYTNNEYSGSNVHIDIGSYDRYGSIGTNNPNLIVIEKAAQLGIGMDRWDNYGDKGESYRLEDFLNKDMSLDARGNIIDTTGNPIGILASDGLYYPPSSSGAPVQYQTVGTYPHYNTTKTSCPINRFYHYAIAMQTPVYKTKATQTGDSSDSKYDSNVDIRNYISFTEEEKKLALGVIGIEAGKLANNCSLECWGRVLRNRLAQGNDNNLWHCASVWLGSGQSYSKNKALSGYNGTYKNYTQEQKDIIWNVLTGYNYGYIETALKNNEGAYENNKYGNIEYLYNLNMLGGYHWWQPQNLIAWFEAGGNNRISPGYAPDVNKNKKLFPCPEWLKK